MQRLGKIFQILQLSLLLLGCFSLDAKQLDFDKQMGKGTTSWDYIRTPEDKERLACFKQSYESFQMQAKMGNEQLIPKIIHWVWIGPRELPAHSIEKMKKWIDLHPDWTFTLWADHDQKGIANEVQVCNPIPLLKELEDCFYNADNFGEKSEVVRLKILQIYGGVYIDHDVIPLKALDDFLLQCSFFCGLETLKPTILSSSVYPSTHFMGSIASHPVLEKGIQWLISNWDRLETLFPGTDEMSIANRIKHRGFKALDAGLQASQDAVVFPASFFSESHPEKGLYAIHEHLGTWIKREEDEKIRQSFAAAEEEIEFSLLVAVAFGLLNVLMCAFLIKTLRTQSLRSSA